jgi:beta-lactamase superfamily II metal-dependent hydrolase
MLQIGDAYLLFPGDAQWGTWNSAMMDKEWRRLLSKTTFYKIGHHGSHNATPKSFVSKLLPENFWAMACTGPTANWTDTIPLPNLMSDLRSHSPKVVRSDKDDDPAAEQHFTREQHGYFVDAKIPIYSDSDA